MRADAKAVAGAVGRAISPLGSMITKGVGAVKRAVGQSPPTPQDVYAFLRDKQIPNADNIAKQLIALKVLPHTRFSADYLKYDPVTNRNRWDRELRLAGVSNRLDRYNILNDLVKADIAVWMPFVESDSGR
jgi:hypothetical protein